MKAYKLLLIILVNTSVSFGQIFSTKSNPTGITILPEGIKNTDHSSSEVTNIGLGPGNLEAITTGTKNVAIGTFALGLTTSGSQLTAVGNLALSKNTTGTLNSALGRYSLVANKTGNENTGVGAGTLSGNTSLSRNVAVGAHALREQNYTGNNNSDNVAVGYGALLNNNPTDASNGRQNVAVGNLALTENKTGARNIALGDKSSTALTTGNDNVSVGPKALYNNIIGSKNTAIGQEALYETLGSGNVAIGSTAGSNEEGDNKLYIAKTGDFNTPLIGGDFAAKKVAINRNLYTTNPNDFNNRTETLQVGGEAFKTAGNGNWVFPSDLRLKKNISALGSQEMLQKVLQMQGVTYEMADTTQQGLRYGFIAQELREIFPSKVKENKAGYLSADYGSYDPMIVESIKGLNQKINDLKKDKIALETTLTNLLTDFDTLLTKTEQLEATRTPFIKANTITEK